MLNVNKNARVTAWVTYWSGGHEHEEWNTFTPILYWSSFKILYFHFHFRGNVWVFFTTLQIHNINQMINNNTSSLVQLPSNHGTLYSGREYSFGWQEFHQFGVFSHKQTFWPVNGDRWKVRWSTTSSEGEVQMFRSSLVVTKWCFWLTKFLRSQNLSFRNRK